MYHFRSNPPSRQIAPAAIYAPSAPRPDPLRDRVDAFLATSDMSLGGFGRLAAGRFGLVRELRAGATVDDATRAKVNRFLDLMEANHA